MSKIDVYIKNLVNHRAQALVLKANQMVVLRFDSGNRAMKKMCTEEEILALAQEVMEGPAIQSFGRTGRTRFTYESPFGAVALSLERASDGLVCEVVQGAAEPEEPEEPPLLEIPTLDPESLEPPPEEPSAPEIMIPEEPAAAPAAAPVAAAPAAAPAASRLAARGPATPSADPAMNHYLRAMTAQNASDLHVHALEVPALRVHGGIAPMGTQRMPAEGLEHMMFEVLTEHQKQVFTETHDLDFAYALPGVGRFRMNYLMDRRGVGFVARMIPEKILTLDELGTPACLRQLCTLNRGLVVVTGPTGSGKSTTLAAMIDHVNATRNDHILTLEDPIEFVHNNRSCLVTQREIGHHSRSFATGLRAALREDPDVILVGEMRDLETISLAIETAETGHLVFGTLHTNTAPSTVDRIIDVFPADRQAQIRSMLSISLKGVVAQTLCKKMGGGRVAAYEVMLGMTSVANLIREGKTFQLDSAIQMGRKDGMMTLNDCLFGLAQKKLITPEEAYSRSLQRSEMKNQLSRLGWEPPDAIVA